MGEIRHRHIQAPLAAAISPLAISPNTLMNYIFCDDGLSETTRARFTVEPHQKGMNWYKSNPDFNSDGQPPWRSLTFGVFQKRDKETKGTSKWKLIPLEK